MNQRKAWMVGALLVGSGMAWWIGSASPQGDVSVDVVSPRSPRTAPMPRASVSPRPGPAESGTDVDRVRARLAGFDPAAPEGPKRFADAVFALREAPHLAQAFAEVAADASASVRTREAAADVLAQEGSPASQDALRALLDRPDVRDDGMAPWLVQRVGMITAPTPETARWMVDRIAGAEGEDAQALAFAAGAVSGRPGVSDEARAALDGALQRAMGAADPELRAAGTAGWGNRHREDGLSTLVAMAGDADPRVRAAAVWAGRHVPDAGADGLVVLGAQDPSWTVQRVALKVAATREPSETLGQVVTQLATGDVDPRVADELTHAVDRQLVGASRDVALRSVLAQAVDAPSLRARIRGMLAEP